MPSAQTMLDAYWTQRESGVLQPRGEGMRVKRILIALARLMGDSAAPPRTQPKEDR